MRDRVQRKEEEVLELKTDMTKLQNKMDTKVAAHDREISRMRLANKKVIEEYKESNKELQRRVGGAGVAAADSKDSPEENIITGSNTVTDNSTLEVSSVVVV